MMPLSGIRVLDLSRVLTGPYCTMVLADLGAEVTKIERPHTGDDTRAWGPPFIGQESAYYLSVNRQKRSVTVDFSTPEGRDIILRLARRSDVLVENFRPGVLRKLGLGHEAVLSECPRLIYCSITGFGQDGPYAHYPAYDLILQAMGGLMGITGPSAGEPVRIGVAIVDIVAGMFAAISILAALRGREESGRGQRIDVSLLDAEVAILSYMAGNYFATGQSPARMGSAHPSIVPYQAFKASDDYIVVAVGNEAIWKRFCAAIGLPNLREHPSFATNERRVENRDQLIAIISDVLGKKSAGEWEDVLLQNDIPASRVNSIAQVMEHPQIEHREMVRWLEHPSLGPIRALGPPMLFSETPLEIKAPPPALGQHRDAVLHELGFTDLEIRDLAEKRVI